MAAAPAVRHRTHLMVFGCGFGSHTVPRRRILRGVRARRVVRSAAAGRARRSVVVEFAVLRERGHLLGRPPRARARGSSLLPTVVRTRHFLRPSSTPLDCVRSSPCALAAPDGHGRAVPAAALGPRSSVRSRSGVASDRKLFRVWVDDGLHHRSQPEPEHSRAHPLASPARRQRRARDVLECLEALRLDERHPQLLV